jgi:tetratricopeptide (TPR) repeat protein
VRGQTPTESIELQRQAAEYQARAAAARPNEPRYKSDWALTLNNLGAAYAAANDIEQAVAAYQKAIALQKALLRVAPLDREFRRDLAVSYNNLGLAFAQSRQTDNAQRSFKNAVGFQEQLAAENPRDLETLSSLGGVYNNLGIMLEQLGRTSDAVESFQKAVDRQKAAQAQAPTVDRYREFLSRHYYNLGRALRKLGKAEEAAKTALARKELWRDNPERLLSVAEELALASQMLSAVDPSKGSADDCAQWSVATLREAVAAGLNLPDDLDRQSSFAALRGRADFDHLLHP